MCSGGRHPIEHREEHSLLRRMSKVAHANGSPLRVHARRRQLWGLQEVYHVPINQRLNHFGGARVSRCGPLKVMIGFCVSARHQREGGLVATSERIVADWNPWVLVTRDQTHGWIRAGCSLLISEDVVCGANRVAPQFAMERLCALGGEVAGLKKAPLRCG